MITYEEYAAGHGKCMRMSEILKQAAEQQTTAAALVNAANAAGITVIMWA